MRALALTLVLATGVGLAGCNTVKGAQKDVYSVGRTVARLSNDLMMRVRNDGRPTVTPELEIPPFEPDAHKPKPPVFPDGPTSTPRPIQPPKPKF